MPYLQFVSQFAKSLIYLTQLQVDLKIPSETHATIIDMLAIVSAAFLFQTCKYRSILSQNLLS